MTSSRLQRHRTDLPADVYPDDPWGLVEDDFASRFLYLTETIFALSNGYLGIRGTQDEGGPVHQHGSFVNGYHETWPIVHPESAYGFAHTGQTIVNVPDATVVQTIVDGEALDLDSSDVVSYRRWLHFRTGVLDRIVTWRTAAGTTVTQWTRRLVSLDDRHLAAIWMYVTVDRPATVEVMSRLVNRQDEGLESRTFDEFDPRQGASFDRPVLDPVARTVDDGRVLASWVTHRSRLAFVAGIDHIVETANPWELSVDGDHRDTLVHIVAQAAPLEPLMITKLAAYHAGGDEDTAPLVGDALKTLDRAASTGFVGLELAQIDRLRAFWRTADVQVDAGAEIQRTIRWTLLQLHMASALIRETSIPAKGLTGQAYDGHYFWDTEIYVLPFLVFTDPSRAAEVLRFRHSLLPAARDRAAELSEQGALFPWRTITGEEASAYYAAGSAQYHIDADIVYALRKYVEVTGDHDLLRDIGVDLVVESARMWMSLGFFRRHRFHIHGVTGPDEYTALVDDNAYTNVMARMNLYFAADVVQALAEDDPDMFAGAADRLGLDSLEPVAWRIAADSMYVPHDATRGITPQDDDFLSKERWDFGSTPSSQYPLLLHFHPLVIYRFQVLKQADVVLAGFLLEDDFDPDVLGANFDYYDSLTTGDSSLSSCVQSIAAARMGRDDLALQYFEDALFTDLADLHGNTTDGVHMASAGGMWQSIVYGFAGLRDAGGRLSLTPSLPSGWSRLRFPLLVRGTRIWITITADEVDIEATEGGTLEIVVWGRRTVVAPGRRARIVR